MTTRIAEFQSAEDIEDITFDTMTPEEKTSQQRKLEQVIGGLNDKTDDAYIAVYKQLGTGKESMSLVNKWPIDQFDSVDDMLIYLRDNYGAGQYRVHVRVEGKLKANNLVSVAAPLEKTVDNADGAIGQVLLAMEQQNQRFMQLVNSLQNRGPSEDEQEEKMLRKMMLYKQLFASDAPQAGGFKEILGTIEGLKQLGINVGVGGSSEEKEDSLVNILEKAAPIVTAALTQNAQNPQVQPKPNPQARHPDMNMIKKMQLKAGLGMLIKGAQSGGDPYDYAAMVGQQVDSATIKGFLDDPLNYQKVLSLDPACAAHKEWFDDLLEHVKAQNGRPSKFDGEYDDLTDSDGNDINAQTDDKSQTSDPLSANGNTQRPSGNTANA